MVQMPRIDEIRGAIWPRRNQKTPVWWDGGASAGLPASLGGANQVEWRGGLLGRQGGGSTSTARKEHAESTTLGQPRVCPDSSPALPPASDWPQASDAQLRCCGAWLTELLQQWAGSVRPPHREPTKCRLSLPTCSLLCRASSGASG